MAMFLAEQYWPDVTPQRLRAAVERLSVGGDGNDAAGRVVAIVFTPDDDCTFYLVDGASEAAVSVLVARTGRPADRVQRCERLQ